MERNSRADVVERALDVLDRHGLADLTMRRLGAELGVRPSALYHHVATKQELLAAVADALLARRPLEVPADADLAWPERTLAVGARLREAMLAYTDGAEVVSTAHAFRLGGGAALEALSRAVGASGADPVLVDTGARTLLHFVLGHVIDEQTHLQAAGAGAVDGLPRGGDDFATGLGIVCDGLRVRLSRGARSG